MNRTGLANLQAAHHDVCADEDSSSAGEFDVVSAAPANEQAQEGAANAAGGDQVLPADDQTEQYGAANAAANEEMVSNIFKEVNGPRPTTSSSPLTRVVR